MPYLLPYIAPSIKPFVAALTSVVGGGGSCHRSERAATPGFPAGFGGKHGGRPPASGTALPLPSFRRGATSTFHNFEVVHSDIEARHMNPPIKRGLMSFWTHGDLDRYERTPVEGHR